MNSLAAGSGNESFLLARPDSVYIKVGIKS
jgi:hypothetical protein